MKRLLLCLLVLSGLALAQTSSTGSLTASGSSCVTTRACISLHFPSGPNFAPATASVVLTGTFTATVQFEVSADNGNTWVAVLATPVPSGAAVSSATATGTWTATVAAMTDMRARVSAYTSGTVVVSLLASTASATAAAVASTLDVIQYGALGDNSTDNQAAFTAASAAVNAASGIPTLLVPSGVYKYSDGLSFTQPMNLVCQPGATLNYTGTGKAVTFGPATLTLGTAQSIYRTTGCTWIGGASMTHGLYFAPYVMKPVVKDSYFQNFGPGGSPSAVYAIYTAGTNQGGIEVFENEIWNDDATNGRSFMFTNNLAGNIGDCYLIFHNNVALSWNASGPGSATTGGVGLFSNCGGNTLIYNNAFFQYTPGIRLGPWSDTTQVYNNWLQPVTLATDYPIQFGTPSTSDRVCGVKIYNNDTFGGLALIGPSDVNNGICNTSEDTFGFDVHDNVAENGGGTVTNVITANNAAINPGGAHVYNNLKFTNTDPGFANFNVYGRFLDGNNHITQPNANNDFSGIINLTSGTSVTYTFVKSYRNAPRCIITPLFNL